MTPRKRRTYSHIRGVRLRRDHANASQPLSLCRATKAKARHDSCSHQVMRLHLEIMFFKYIEPCSPALVKTVPAGDDWQYEIKFDGFRVRIHKLDDEMELYSRSGAGSAGASRGWSRWSGNYRP
jgi:ATP-dependent DNA ligase